MNLKDILEIRKTGKILPDSDLINNLIGLKMAGPAGSRYLEEWDFTSAYPLIGKNGTTLTLKGSGVTAGLYGIAYQGGVGQGGFILPSELSGPGLFYEIQFNNFSGTFAYPNTCFLFSSGLYNNIEQMNKGLCFDTPNGKWYFDGTSYVASSITEKSPFANSLVRIEVDSDRKPHIYKDGEIWWEPNIAIPSNHDYFCIGGYPYYYMMQIASLKVGSL